MKRLLLPFLALALLSCNKNVERYEQKKLADTLRIIDSINAARTVYNDSIRVLNGKNIYRDLSGSHRLTHSEISAPGKVFFTKTARDEYKISGKAASGSDFVEVNGKVELVTEKYLNFEGVIFQKIQGKPYKRSAKTSFKDEKKGSFWRMQNKVNSDGFVDHIDIHF